MSPFYATHAGMLAYVARAFDELARDDGNPDGQRLAIYATILDRMVGELTATTAAAPAVTEMARSHYSLK